MYFINITGGFLTCNAKIHNNQMFRRDSGYATFQEMVYWPLIEICCFSSFTTQVGKDYSGAVLKLIISGASF